MIRQAISCDICASEKRQTNHWFVAYEQAGELRVSGWNSRHRLRSTAKHLCGQTCLHKLVEEFMAKSIAVQAQHTVDDVEPEPPVVGDASLTSSAAYADPGSPRSRGPQEAVSASWGGGSRGPQETVPASWGGGTGPGPGGGEPESSARVLMPPAPDLPKPLYRPQPEIVTMAPRPHGENYAPIPEETPRYASRAWRAEAWERERERELRAIENRPEIAARRRSNA